MAVDFFGGGGGNSFSTIKLDDTDASNYLSLDWNENDSSDRTLGILVGGGNRTITLSGNPTLGDWFDQAVKAASSPTHAGLTLTGFSGYVKASTGVLSAGAIADGDIPSALTGKTYNGLTLTSATTGFTVAGGTTSKTLTVELDSLVNQDLTTDASPAHAGLTLGSVSANGILNLYGLHANGYYNIIQGSNAEGLVGADLRIGLDETNRTLIVCDRSDIGTDFGLTAETGPTINIRDAAGTGYIKLTSSSVDTSGALTITSVGGGANISINPNNVLQSYNCMFTSTMNQDISWTGGYFCIDSAIGGFNKALTCSSARQSFLYLNGIDKQTGTGAFDLIYGNATLTTVGTGATGDGNNLLNLSVSSVPRFLVNVNGSVGAGQVSVSLADNAVHDTGVASFYGLLIVKDTTTGVSAIYRVDGGATPVAVSAHTNFSTSQGTDNKINVYFDTTYKIENCNTAASVVRCAFIGVT